VREGDVGAVVPTGAGAGAAAARVLTAWSADPVRHEQAREAAMAWRSDHHDNDPYAEAAADVAALARTVS
jgi:hypothetical protein